MPEPRSPRSHPPRFAAADGLRVREMDDEAVVFDPVAWDAHLLNPAARAVLELLLDGPRTERDVTEFLAHALHADEQAAAAEHARRLLGELQSLGLVRTIDV